MIHNVATMRMILALLFILAAVGAEEPDLTSEQKLAALVFTDVQAIDVTTLVMAEIPSEQPGEDDSLKKVAVYPPLKIEKNRYQELLAMIAMAGNYHFRGSPLCFEPGMRIRIHEKQRIVTLKVCLKCMKMSVSTTPRKSFIVDFSNEGLAAYKAAYLDFIVLKKGLERE